MSATSTTGRAALVAANGRARRPAEPPQGDLSHAEAQRGGERRDCCQCENVANTQSQYPIGTGNNGTGNTSTMATFSSLPKGWEVMKLYGCFTESTAKNSSLSFTRAMQFNYGRIVDKNESFETDEVKDIYAKYSLVKKGDIVINGLNLNYDVVSQRVAIVPKDGIITSAYIVLRPREGTYPEFFCYLFKALDSRKIFHGMGTGIRLTLSFKELKNMPIPLPPLPKQKAIVAYLDAETGRIDKAIAAEEKMIALLQERREIVINEAVGGGDLSHAEAQRGRERRGWDVVQLKRIVDTPITDGPHETPTFVDGDGIPFVSAEASHDGRIFLNECRGLILRKDHERFCQKVRPRRNDIFIVKSGSTTGKVVMVDFDEEFSIWSPLALVRVSRRANTRFVFYCLMSQGFQQQVKDNWSFGTQPNIGMSAIARLVIPLPPLPEQEAIVERLDRETGKIDRAIEVKRRQIELLRERRQIVIDEVVTGKVKVA